TMSASRFRQYLDTANGDRHLALRLYVWNARLCEEFYIPIQFTEVALRNAIHNRLWAVFGPQWYVTRGFEHAIPDRHKAELAKVVSEQQAKRGPLFTSNHVVAGLTFGFWLYLMGSRFEFHLCEVVWGPRFRISPWALRGVMCPTVWSSYGNSGM